MRRAFPSPLPRSKIFESRLLSIWPPAALELAGPRTHLDVPRRSTHIAASTWLSRRRWPHAAHHQPTTAGNHFACCWYGNLRGSAVRPPERRDAASKDGSLRCWRVAEENMVTAVKIVSRWKLSTRTAHALASIYLRHSEGGEQRPVLLLHTRTVHGMMQRHDRGSHHR